MNESPKDKLSRHVEEIFKAYSVPGLHICDIATGGGKSYTIGKLTCEYYPDEFDRIVILCVQNKLVDGMNREIDRFINAENSLISPSDKMVIENNPEVITKAIKSNCFQKLLEEMNYQIGEQKNADYKVNDIQYSYNAVNKIFKGLEGLIKTLDDNGKNDYILGQINEGEAKLRRAVRGFFDTYKRHLEKTKQQKKVSLETILRLFPSLVKVYPQVDYRRKRVLLMTVHKAMYGIDPILSEKIYLQDIAEKNKKTLILFDESDQAAVAMRTAIIDQSIEKAGGSKRFAKGYNGYLQYKDLIDSPEQIANEYYGDLLEECLNKAKKITKANWEKAVGNILPYKNIFLGNNEEIETYRRGVFFSGPALKLNISQRGDNTNSYICYRKNDRHFCLVHAKDDSQLTKEFAMVIPLDRFLSLIIGNTTSIKAQLRKVISESLKRSREQFEAEEKEVSANTTTVNHYLGYPTLEREIHTLFSRFETTSEYQFEQQINEFMTNRKNLFVSDGDNKMKLPDFSVYSQGVQLYQEEIDERDNQHRVRLSCREIATTPEKILIDLVNTEGTSVVLCSATASCWSVVSNCDIKYLKQVLGGKVQVLSKKEREEFDRLVDMTYPSDHQIQVVPLEKYEYEDKRENAIALPDKYKQMFSPDALEEGLADKWFKLTYRGLKKTAKNIDDMTFRLYRFFQFIETYHWFITHDDIHSMIYFQNRTGDKDKDQINVLSCLIDGTYKKMAPSLEDEIPSSWENEHIRISKDWEDVESNILSELSQNKDAKLMLVSAYGSFKAGANMQYEIPEGLDCTSGDNWISEGEKLKKDWDAIYVQSPTAYLMMNDDGNEATFEKSLYNAMLTLMMLYERGCLSRADVAQWLCYALSNNFMFGEKRNPGIVKDKAAWAQTTVEQAIGRLCRTRNKPHITYILFDESMKPFFDAANMEKSLTKEFRALAEYILSHQGIKDDEIDPEEVMRCNDANYAQGQLDRLRRIALRYTPHQQDEYEFDEDTDGENELPYNVKISQIMNQSYKQTIIKKPVIASIEELDEYDKRLTFMPKCYGDWKRNSDCELVYHYDERFRACPSGKGKMFPYPISPSYVRLDVLMKNPVIKSHFERNGFATTWEKDGLILHPQILATDYAGEIGEEAFKAILLYYTDCTEDDVKHLEGRDYELADFVITNEDGSYRIAFDVKNMNPKVDHNDKDGDMPTTKKREIKRKRLGCELITVNMLHIIAAGMDEIREIGGVIDENGCIIPSAIERIQKLVNKDNI
jgi:hypothetical protein